MRSSSKRTFLALLLLAPLLAGCLERGQPTMADTSGDDDAFCARNHAVGSTDFVNCRKDRDVITRVDGHEAVEIEVYKEADANIVDMAPTLLAALGQPVPTGMTGKPMLHVFEHPLA